MAELQWHCAATEGRHCRLCIAHCEGRLVQLIRPKEKLHAAAHQARVPRMVAADLWVWSSIMIASPEPYVMITE